MRTINEYKMIAENAIDKIKKEPDIGKVTYPEKYILAEICEGMEQTVKAFIPLIVFKENHNLSSRIYILYLQYVLPQLVSRDAMCGYFLKLLIEGHNDPASWTQCSKRSDFKRIVGLTFVFKESFVKGRGGRRNNRYYWILEVFNYTYDELFTVELRYPQELIKEVERCFLEKVPMPQTYTMFTALYLGRRDVPYLNFIANVLYLRYGAESMREYIDTVIKQYVAEFGACHAGQANLMDIMHYIFGGRFARSVFEMSRYTSGKYKDYDTPIFLFKSTLLRAAWPYVYINYASSHEQAYAMMRLTEEEREAYEQKYFGRPVRRNRAAKAKVLIDPYNLELPHGTAYETLKTVVKRYYEFNALPKRVIPLRSTALTEIITMTTQNAALAKDLKHIRANSSLTPILASLMEDQENQLRAKYSEGNIEEIYADKDVIRIYYYHKGRYQYRKIDYSVISSSDFRRESKMFCRAILGKKVSTGSIAKVTKCIRFCVDMINDCQVRRCMDVTRGHICIWLHRKQCKGIKPTTITEELSVIRSFLGTIMDCKSYILRPEKNVAQNIRCYGARDHIKSRPVIPDDILIFIEDHAWELDEEWRLLFQILRQTSWRFDDAANIRIDGIYEIGNPEYAGIKTVISKTLKQRRQNGLGDYIEDVITIELYQELQEYIAGTDKVRKRYETDYVFFSCYGGMAHQEEANTFSNAVNELLARHGICSIDSTYKSFSSSQTRATGATALIEAGVGLPIVQHKLGHLHAETTAKHYARVREKRRGELDKEFFEKRFADLFDPQKLVLLTEKERTALYENFAFGSRKVEFGKCVKTPCGGTCLRHRSAECAECTKLLTGPQNLPAWQGYLEDSDRRLSELLSAYVAQDITPEVYREFSEYKEESKRNRTFREIIEKINEWKEGHG